MRRPFSDKRPVGPVFTSSSSVGSNTEGILVEFIFTGSPEFASQQGDFSFEEDDPEGDILDEITEAVTNHMTEAGLVEASDDTATYSINSGSSITVYNSRYSTAIEEAVDAIDSNSWVSVPEVESVRVK